MNKIKLILKSIFLPERDKCFHWLSGIYIFLILDVIGLLIFDRWINWGWDSLIALSIVIVIGIGKEVIWDNKLNKGTPDVADAVYTAMGAISVFALTL